MHKTYLGGELNITIARRVWRRNGVKVFQDTTESYDPNATLQRPQIASEPAYATTAQNIEQHITDLKTAVTLYDNWSSDTGKSTKDTLTEMEASICST